MRFGKRGSFDPAETRKTVISEIPAGWWIKRQVAERVSCRSFCRMTHEREINGDSMRRAGARHLHRSEQSVCPRELKMRTPLGACAYSIERESRYTRARRESRSGKLARRRNMKLTRAASAGGSNAIITLCLLHADVYFWLQSINRTRLKYGSGCTWCSSINGRRRNVHLCIHSSRPHEEKTFLLSPRAVPRSLIIDYERWRYRLDGAARSRKLIVLKKL